MSGFWSQRVSTEAKESTWWAALRNWRNWLEIIAEERKWSPHRSSPCPTCKNQTWMAKITKMKSIHCSCHRSIPYSTNLACSNITHSFYKNILKARCSSTRGNSISESGCSSRKTWKLTSLSTIYFNTYFREGYLRTSSTEYTTDKSNLDNDYIHLTNNAV